MPYLNLDVDFFTHRKTLRLIGLLGDASIPCLLRLWSYAAKHHVENGMLTGLTACELESIVGWRGESGVLMLTLTNLGFVDIISNNCRIHGWKEHAGHLIAFKKRAKAAAYTRWNKHATSMQQALLEDKSSTAKLQIANTPNLSYPNPPNPFRTVPKDEELGAPSVKASSARIDKRKSLEDFEVTDTIREWARKEHGIEIPDDVLAEFKDHWRKEPDKKLRLDWTATFQGNIRKLVGWGILKPSVATHPTVMQGIKQKCQERVQRGNFLKPCNEPSVTVMGGRPLCQEHKEYHERKSHPVTA